VARTKKKNAFLPAVSQDRSEESDAQKRDILGNLNGIA
jgi:hypothetical protein